MNKILYEHTADVHNTRAAEIVVPILFQYMKPKSVLDIGCGIGTWLRVFKDQGVSDILGVDGSYVNRVMLQIEEANFLAHDLREPLDLKKEYELVVSLEVAEHLPESVAETFVESLVRHGKVILFSAAIPGQGGQNHLNEQWPSYWQEKFLKHGYHYYDLIRPQIWSNEKVERWYKQNIFVLFHESIRPPFSIFQGDNLLHPEYWSEIENIRKALDDWMSGNVGVANAFKALVLAVCRKIKKLH